MDLSQAEVGWFGSVREIGNDFLIEEVFLFTQEVSLTETDVSGGGQTELVTELLSTRSDGVDIVNRIRFWGHSHVWAGTTPSAQDETQMKEFVGDCDYFIRGIFNKSGRAEFTIFLYKEGLVIEDAEWAIYDPLDESLRNEIAGELAAKVTKKSSRPSSHKSQETTGG